MSIFNIDNITDIYSGDTTIVEAYIGNNRIYRKERQWAEKNTWNILFHGCNIWKDGNTIYYSNDSSEYQGLGQYVLDIVNDTWLPKTWNKETEFNLDARSIWIDGNNIYHSHDNHYILDRSTDTWITKTWNGSLKPDYGDCVWSDGNNIYYSQGQNQYVLDRSTNTWITKTWNGGSSNGNTGYNIWKDGNNIYYSDSINHYILDRSTDTWLPKTWNGFTNFSATYIWTDGVDIYYSQRTNQYVLDRSTDTWIQKVWDISELNSLIWGDGVWSDGYHIYWNDLRRESQGQVMLSYEFM